jgi:hypothetical protein
MKPLKLVLGDGPTATEHIVDLSDENAARMVRHAKSKFPHVWDMDGSITGEAGSAVPATEEESVTMLLNKVVGLLAQQVQEEEELEATKGVKPIILHPEAGRRVGLVSDKSNLKGR